MAFERFVPRSVPSSPPKVLIRPSGLISFDANAVKSFDLEGKTHAVLFFDRNKKAIGVHFTNDSGEDGAVKITKRRRTVGASI